jgi:hypothetical protein
MTNHLLKKRDENLVDHHWSNNFINRTSELKTKWNRSYDRQRALNEESSKIRSWFDLMRNMKAKYDIRNENVHNFDETNFMMSVITSQLIVTDSEKREKRKIIQSSNRE